MNRTTIGRVAGAAAAVGALGLAGATLANAASTPTPSPSSTAGPGQSGDRPARGGHEHTPVTGDELAKVTAAVKAKDSAVTVTKVEKDADGSYDVSGTKAGERVRLEVSADLATITERAGRGGPGGKGGRGGHEHTPVTGDELAKVTAAVKSKDSAVTVTKVEKDPDGSYDVSGTKAGVRVRLEVSADLKTITEGRAMGPGGKGPRDAGTEVTGTEKTNVANAATAKVSGLTVESVRKRSDGSYVVLGTKAVERVLVSVSADLKTVTERTGRGPGGKGERGPRGGTPPTGTPTPSPSSTT